MIVLSFLNGFGGIFKEVFLALTPLFIIFLFFQFFILKLEQDIFIRIIVGFLFTFVGIAFFLQGVYAGFMPIGQKMGEILGTLPYRWIIIPIGFILGFAAILAEPAVHVMIEQVERVSGGYIPQKVMLYSISLGVAFAVALAMARILYVIPLAYILIPGYLLAFFMIRFAKENFISMAFDSGGVATGPMTVSFILAMAIGLANSIEGCNPILEGFGMISLVALAPIITVLTLGFIYARLYKDLEDNNDQNQPQEGY